MNTASLPHSTPRHPSVPAFSLKLSRAVADLKHRLQLHYERIHPSHGKLIRGAIAEAEALAWDLSSFPHLLLPDLVEARIEELALVPDFITAEPAIAWAA